jgi:hypothetical protein
VSSVAAPSSIGMKSDVLCSLGPCESVTGTIRLLTTSGSTCVTPNGVGDPVFEVTGGTENST